MALLALTVGAAGAAMAAGHRPAPKSAPQPAAPSLCQSGESVLYSCPFARGTGSVCMGGGHLHYRFGKPGQVAIDIVNKPDWSNVHMGSLVGHGLNAEDHIRFTNRGTDYIVYDGTAGPSSDRAAGARVLAGVEVRKDGRLLQRDKCMLPKEGSLLESQGSIQHSTPRGTNLDEDDDHNIWYGIAQ